MGLDLERDRFEDDEYARFGERLVASVDALGQLLARPGFGRGAPTVGAELEMFLVDEEGHPRSINRQVLAGVLDPRVKLELARFNLELNSDPAPLAGRPFTALGEDMSASLAEVARAAREHGARPVLVGILPTLGTEHLGSEAISDIARYRALSFGLRRLRREPFHIHIAGDDPIELDWDDVTLEGANTAYQLHLRVDPEDFAAVYNAAQLATAPALAVSCNSPFLVGHRLWEETRVALFKQAVDARGGPWRDWRFPARVNFGHGWVREGAHELFEEAVALHPPVVAPPGGACPLEELRRGELPELHELRLHCGTVWRWNRAVYDPVEGGHLRVELRALPAGPTMIDMLASSAFVIGLTLGLAPRMRRVAARMPFEYAHRNFYRAAQRGLDAELLWPSDSAPSPQGVRADELVQRLMPIAEEGLLRGGVDAEEVRKLLPIVERRARSGRTGAQWQRRVLDRLERRLPRREALQALLLRYMEHSATDTPVHTWPLDG